MASRPIPMLWLQKMDQGVCRVRLYIFALLIPFLIGQASAKMDVGCPSALSEEHLKTLKDTGEITLQDASFRIDGASEKMLKTYEVTAEAPFAYERTDSHKLACWYECGDKYLCIRQK